MIKAKIKLLTTLYDHLNNYIYCHMAQQNPFKNNFFVYLRHNVLTGYKTFSNTITLSYYKGLTDNPLIKIFNYNYDNDNS